MTSIQTVAARKETVSLELATKIDGITNGCSKPYFSNALKRMGDSNPENCAIIYVITFWQNKLRSISRIRPRKAYKSLDMAAAFVGNKSFRHMTKLDIDSLRRPLSEDASRGWIGSYNSRQMILNKFFRWLYNPDEPDHKKGITPRAGLV